MKISLQDASKRSALFVIGDNSKMLNWGDQLNLSHVEDKEIHLVITKTFDDEVFVEYKWVDGEASALYRESLERIAEILGINRKFHPDELVSKIEAIVNTKKS